MSDTEPITAAGGVLYKKHSSSGAPLVILIFRRGVWDLPKGKIEKGESIRECAVREVAEEIGLSIYPEIVGTLSETYHEYEQDGIFYGKTTHWFAMRVEDWTSESLEPETNEGIEKVQWFSMQTAEQVVGYENLSKVLESFSSWYNSVRD